MGTCSMWCRFPGRCPFHGGLWDHMSLCHLHASPCPFPPPLGLALEFTLQIFNPGFSFAQRQQDLGTWPIAACTGCEHHRAPPSPIPPGPAQRRRVPHTGRVLLVPSIRQGSATSSKTLCPPGTSAAAQPVLAEEVWWRLEICWASPSPP